MFERGRNFVNIVNIPSGRKSVRGHEGDGKHAHDEDRVCRNPQCVRFVCEFSANRTAVSHDVGGGIRSKKQKKKKNKSEEKRRGTPRCLVDSIRKDEKKMRKR